MTARGENDDGNLCSAWISAQRGSKLHAVQFRHLEVADDNIDVIRTREFKRDRSIPRCQDSVPALCELQRQHMHDCWLIINHKNGSHSLHFWVPTLYAAIRPTLSIGTENQKREPIPPLDSTPM